MAEIVVMPKLGNTVETCLIVDWQKQEGDSVEQGDILCTVETDKAAVDVESTAGGVLRKILYSEGEEVPVLLPIAVVGTPGEDIGSLLSEIAASGTEKISDEMPPLEEKTGKPVIEPLKGMGTEHQGEKTSLNANTVQRDSGSFFASPRAKNLAVHEGMHLSAIAGSGPHGRIIERDVKGNLSSVAPATAAAIDQLKAEGGTRPVKGSGIGGRVMRADIGTAAAGGSKTGGAECQSVVEVPLKGVRKVIADTMLRSVTTTAQFTLHTHANAENLKVLRERLKKSPESYGLSKISLNDLVMFAVIKTLKEHPEMNAHFLGDRIVRYSAVHLGIAVDTPKGLMVPVAKNVQNLSLKEFSDYAKNLYRSISMGDILPDDLSGSTFTVTNLGGLGIEKFTPVLNIPEVAILGVCTIEPKAVYAGSEIVFKPSIGLSLTINHMAVDGAPAARFLQTLCFAIENIDLLTAL